MTFPATRPTAPKGKLKCFKCRTHVSARDGAWDMTASQQVFICARCEAEKQRLSQRPAFRKSLVADGVES